MESPIEELSAASIAVIYGDRPVRQRRGSVTAAPTSPLAASATLDVPGGGTYVDSFPVAEPVYLDFSEEEMEAAAAAAATSPPPSMKTSGTFFSNNWNSEYQDLLEEFN